MTCARVDEPTKLLSKYHPAAEIAVNSSAVKGLAAGAGLGEYLYEATSLWVASRTRGDSASRIARRKLVSQRLFIAGLNEFGEFGLPGNSSAAYRCDIGSESNVSIGGKRKPAR